MFGSQQYRCSLDVAQIVSVRSDIGVSTGVDFWCPKIPVTLQGKHQDMVCSRENSGS